MQDAAHLSGLYYVLNVLSKLYLCNLQT